MDKKSLLQELNARLPELEWKISSLGAAFTVKSLPRELFTPQLEMTAATCIAEIKADIQSLASQQAEAGIHYLAQRIQRKINVLVTLYHMYGSQPKSERKIAFSLDRLSTRQQWLQSLEHQIHSLTAQQEALVHTLAQLQKKGSTQAVLQLKVELGEVEKHLTLAKETLAQSSQI